MKVQGLNSKVNQKTYKKRYKTQSNKCKTIPSTFFHNHGKLKSNHLGYRLLIHTKKLLFYGYLKVACNAQ